jgi:hypothetical protein
VALDPKLAELVTEFLQDEPQLNVLLNKREFSPSLVKLAIRLMVSSFNRNHFVTAYTSGDFPDGTLEVQIYGTIFHLLQSASLLQVRNHLPYNDAGLSVAQFSKSGELMGLAERFKAQFEESALQIKYDLNIFLGWGGVLSEYAYYGGFAMLYSHAQM